MCCSTVRPAMWFTVFLVLVSGVFAQLEWNQSDWSGGDEQSLWSDSTRYLNDNGYAVIDNPSGEFTINNGLYLGDGSDNDLTVTGDSVRINNATYLVANEGEGDSVILVNNSFGFQTGDEILIIQMQHTTNAGNYEFRFVESVDGNTLYLDSSLSRTYYSGSFNQTAASATQVVRVPHFDDVSIADGGWVTADPWNGMTGGIVVFRAGGSVNFNSSGYISVSERGFRGGAVGPGNNDPGTEGEGIIGRNSSIGPTGCTECVVYPTSGNNGGAGGPGVSHCGGGGGGGGHATVGGFGQTNANSYNDTAYGGYSVGDALLTQIFFGGGGGGGGDDDGNNTNASGGNGGGIVLIFADSVVNARISADGESKPDINDCGSAEGSGGAGGTILVKATAINSAAVSAVGGTGANSLGSDDGHGGDGSDGRIRFEYESSPTGVSPSPTPTQGQLARSDSAFVVSSVFDMNALNSEITGPHYISWNGQENNGSISVKLRTSNTSDMSDAAAWATCDELTNGGNVTGEIDVTPDERYVQYRVSLTKSAQEELPVFDSIQIRFNVPPSQVGLSAPSAGAETSLTPTFDWGSASDNNTDDTIT